MKHILVVIKDFILIGDDVPKLQPTASTMWIAWAIGVIVLFDIAFEDEILSFNSISVIFLGASMAHSIWSFHDKNYVKLKLKKSNKNLLAYLYSRHLIWMIIGEVVQTIDQLGEIGQAFFQKQIVFLLFWFLSIPLVLIHSPKRWCIWAGIIFLISIGYYMLLQWYLSNWNAITFSFICLTIGGVLIAAIVSFKVSDYKIKKLLGSHEN